MPYPLVLINGIISEEPQDQIGVFPKLGLLNGVLVAGNNSLLSLKIVNGVISQLISSPGGVVWDLNSPVSIWDTGGSTWGTDWDVLEEAIWDVGTSTWS